MLGLFCLLLSVGATRLQHESTALQTTEDPAAICVSCATNVTDCQYGAWGMWSLCSTSAQCGGAFTTSRSRVITQNPTGGGAACLQALIQTRQCTTDEQNQLINSQFFTQKCQVPCLVGDWFRTATCSVTAANCPATRTATASISGVEVWSRNVTQQPQYGGAMCPNLQETIPCTIPCPYNCVWGPWMIDAGQCSSNCIPPDGSTPLQQYSRAPVSLAVNGGSDCTGLSRQWTGACQIASSLPPCCPDCNPQGWTPWTACQTSQSYNGQPCGSGTQLRQRAVFPPQDFVASCPSAAQSCPDATQTITCCRGTCPIDCVCGSWTAWSTCAALSGTLQCGNGSSTRTRACTQPQFGGLACGATSQTKGCALAPCPTPCVMDNWGPWSSCGATCGPRQFQTRTRAMVAQATNGGSPCGDSSQTQACPCNPCPLPCQVGPWQSWGPCDQPCGPASQQRVRDVIVEPMYGGTGCPLLVETRNCTVNDDGFFTEINSAGVYVQSFANKPCDVNCQVGPWGDWTPCTQSCLRDDDRTTPGLQTRTRLVIVAPVFKGIACPYTMEQQFCNSQCCPVDCEVAPWGPWSGCSASCGGGTQRHERIIATFARCGGYACQNVTFYEDRPCNTLCCSSPCEYYPYGAWSACLDPTGAPVPCGVNGVRFRERAVKSIDPCNPYSCTDTRQTATCSLGACQTDCVIGPWGAWGDCSVKCGWGMQVRERNLVPPTFGGTPCPCYHEFRPCKEPDCCPDCSLTQWTSWGGCSVSCGSGIQTRHRYVNGTNTACETATCEDNLLDDTQECLLPACPTPCVVSAWTGWSGCDATCDLGVMSRTRTIVSEGDGRCPWLEEQQFCNQGSCPQPCIFADWGVWSTCPLTCQPANGATPTQIRNRFPISLGNQGQGDCPVVIQQVKNCTLYPCVTLCQVSQWSSWTPCVPALGWGQKTRTRTITQQPSATETCPELLQVGNCYATPPPTPCEWSTWFEWGDWSSSCGPATRQRERVLLSAPTTIVSDDNTSVTYDLATCSNYGSPYQIQTGNLPKCPVNCQMSKWSEWSTCVFPGFRTRTRTVLVHQSAGGSACPTCLTEVDECTLKLEQYPPNTCEVQPCPQEV